MDGRNVAKKLKNIKVGTKLKVLSKHPNTMGGFTTGRVLTIKKMRAICGAPCSDRDKCAGDCTFEEISEPHWCLRDDWFQDATLKAPKTQHTTRLELLIL